MTTGQIKSMAQRAPRRDGRITLQKVVLAMMIGINTPNAGIIFFSPSASTNPRDHVVHTKMLIKIWQNAAFTVFLPNQLVRFTIRKNENPIAPEIDIHKVVSFIVEKISIIARRKKRRNVTIPVIAEIVFQKESK